MEIFVSFHYRIYQRFVSNDSLELVITNVSRSDEGSYECQLILNKEMTLARTVQLSVSGRILQFLFLLNYVKFTD